MAESQPAGGSVDVLAGSDQCGVEVVMVSHRRLVAGSLTGALAALVLAVLATAAPGHSDRAASATRVELFEPFGAHGLKAGLRVRATRKGSCWEGSLAAQRSDAWRCLAGNLIEDPCFENPASERSVFVACSPAPWSREIVKIELTKPLPRKYANKGKPPRGIPWAIRTTAGRKCLLVTGATGVVRGKRLNYECGKSEWLIGVPNPKRSVWTIPLWRKGRPLLTARIGTAWW